jgi:hypothetical protein
MELEESNHEKNTLRRNIANLEHQLEETRRAELERSDERPRM